MTNGARVRFFFFYEKKKNTAPISPVAYQKEINLINLVMFSDACFDIVYPLNRVFEPRWLSVVPRENILYTIILLYLEIYFYFSKSFLPAEYCHE